MRESGTTILLVEDQAIIALAEKRTLEQQGFSVITATSAERAIAAMDLHPEIGLILMDIDLGEGIDGPEAAEIILRERDVPVVFMSSHTEPEIVDRTQRITSYGYILKSSDTTILVASIRMALRLFEARMNEQKQRAALESTNAELRETERLLEQTSRMARVGGWETNLATDTVRWSPVKREIHGVGPEYVPDMQDTIRFYQEGESRDRITAAVDRAINTGESYDLELPIITADGRECWVRTAGSAEFRDGRCVRLYGITQDITERVAVAAALQEKAEDLERFFSLARELLCVMDLEGRFIRLNRQWEEFLGYPLAELEGRFFVDAIHPDDVAASKDRLAELKRGGSVTQFVNRCRHRDGTWRHVEWRAGRYDSAIYATVRDVTTDKLAELETLENLGLIIALFDSIPDLVLYKDLDGVYLGCNPEYARHAGLSQQEVVGRTTYDIYPRETADTIRAFDKSVMDTGEPQTREEWVSYPDGRRVLVEFKKTPYRRADGVMIGVLGIGRDITEQKRVARELQQQVREKEIVLREAHHRIKNNIASIAGFIGLQLASSSGEEARRALRGALGRVNSMKELYEKMILVGEERAMPAAPYLRDLVASVVELFDAPAPVTIQENLEEISLDPKQLFLLGIVVNEVVTNSLKYAFSEGKPGAIAVSLRHVGSDLELYLSDDGPGFPEEVLGGGENTGFGVKMVEMLAEQMEATVELQNRPGATVRLVFPVPPE